MALISKISAILFVLVFAIVVHADNAGDDIGRFRARLKSGKSIRGSDGFLTTEDLSWHDGSNKQHECKLKEIQSIDRKVGTYVKTGAMIGAFVGLTSFTFGIIHESKQGKMLTGGTILIALSANTAFCALVGGSVGALNGKWRSVYPGGDDWGQKPTGLGIQLSFKI